MEKALNRWKLVSGVVSLVIALCSYYMCWALTASGSYLGAVYAMYVGVTVAVAGLASIVFPRSNKEAMTVVFYMYLSAALGVVLIIGWSIWDMVGTVVWCIVCSIVSYRIMRSA